MYVTRQKDKVKLKNKKVTKENNLKYQTIYHIIIENWSFQIIYQLKLKLRLNMFGQSCCW